MTNNQRSDSRALDSCSSPALTLVFSFLFKGTYCNRCAPGLLRYYGDADQRAPDQTSLCVELVEKLAVDAGAPLYITTPFCALWIL